METGTAEKLDIGVGERACEASVTEAVMMADRVGQSPKPVDLCGRADRALYEAKSNGRNAAYIADFVEGDGGEYGDCEVYTPCRMC